MDSTENSVPISAPGDFYVEDGCCITCGVPQMVAPDLVGWTDDSYPSCHWKKQPETADEMRQAFAIFDGQDVGCHRYRGHDPEIQARVGYENCDHPNPPEGSIFRGASGPRPETLDNRGMFARLRAQLSRRRRTRSKRGW